MPSCSRPPGAPACGGCSTSAARRCTPFWIIPARKRKGISEALIRPTNVYGPGDKFDLERSHVLPALIRRALEGTGTLDVWGSGEAIRDFIYVTDLVEGLLTVLEKRATCDPVNIGSGRSVE